MGDLKHVFSFLLCYNLSLFLFYQFRGVDQQLALQDEILDMNITLHKQATKFSCANSKPKLCAFNKTLESVIFFKQYKVKLSTLES